MNALTAVRRWMLSATIITIVAVVLIWQAAALPAICPAIYPAPDGCAADARLQPATWGTVAVGMLYASVVIGAFTVPAARRAIILDALCVALALTAFFAVFTTVSASGIAF